MNRNTKLLFLHKLLYDVYFYGALAVPFFVAKGHGLTMALTLASIYMIATMALEVPTGIIGDRYGHKISVLSGTILTGAAFFSLIAVDHILWDTLWITVFAAGAALNSGSDTAILRAISTDFKRDNRTFDYLKSVMLLLSFASAGFIVKYTSLDFAIGLSGLLALVAVIPLLFVKVPTSSNKKIYVSIAAQIKDMPNALKKVNGGLELVVLAGIVGSVMFSAKEIISSFNTVYGVRIELIGIIGALAMGGRIIGTAVEKRIAASYKSLLFILIFIVCATTLIEVNNTIGIILILCYTAVAQMSFYRLKYRLAHQAPESHIASLISGLSLVSRLASGGIILLVAAFTGFGYFYLSFMGIGLLLATIGIPLSTRVK